MIDSASGFNRRDFVRTISTGLAALPVLGRDGVATFTNGGPGQGELKMGNVMLGAVDRVAADAVGLAVLKSLGANEAIMSRGIFQQEQMARAVELKLGVTSPDQIEIVTADAESRAYADTLRAILARG